MSSDIRGADGYYFGKKGTPAEHRTVGDYRAWCHACEEWCYPSAPCGEVRCCTSLTEVDRLADALQKVWVAGTPFQPGGEIDWRRYAEGVTSIIA